MPKVDLEALYHSDIWSPCKILDQRHARYPSHLCSMQRNEVDEGRQPAFSRLLWDPSSLLAGSVSQNGFWLVYMNHSAQMNMASPSKLIFENPAHPNPSNTRRQEL